MKEIKTKKQLVFRTLCFSILLAPILYFSIVGLWWALTTTFILAIFFAFFILLRTFVKKSIYRKLLYILTFVIFSFSSLIIARLLFFDIFVIPTPSMENTILTGDKILVSKIAYGPRLSPSFQNIPGLNLLIRQGAHELNNKFYRLEGIRNIERNDIIIFNRFDNKNYVKRCIGLPGDSLCIVNGEIIINNSHYTLPNTVLQRNFIWSSDRKQLYHELNENDISSASLALKPHGAEITLSTMEKAKLLRNSPFDSISLVLNYPKNSDSISYPKSRLFSWTLDNMGPLYVPQKGSSITLTNKNYAFFKDVFTKYEHVQIEEVNGEFYMKNESITRYTFKQDYYFVMGDNRTNTKDSRSWGFVPISDIQGKAIFVLFSSNNKTSELRLLKQIL